MTTAQISRRVDELVATGIPVGEAIAQAVTEAWPDTEQVPRDSAR